MRLPRVLRLARVLGEGLLGLAVLSPLRLLRLLVLLGLAGVLGCRVLRRGLLSRARVLRLLGRLLRLLCRVLRLPTLPRLTWDATLPRLTGLVGVIWLLLLSL